MSNNGETKMTIEPVMQPFVDFWSNYMQQANDATRELFDGFEDGAQFKNWQRRWMDAVSQSADAYMRTPAFLEAMKHNTNAAVKFKRQADDWANEMARNANIPTTGDISGLFERMHSVEETILKRLARIDERLESIEVQLRAGQLTG
jgi:uncharacterized protein YdiU (UPF0061 family)